jgi:NAD(P)H-hydrate epimerase
MPAVVDADALNILASMKPARKTDLVLTPHPGEMARLLRVTTHAVLRDRSACAEKPSRRWGCVAVLKGHDTIISGRARTGVNATGGPGLAKGGSGDVLTGLVAGLWAQMLASGRVQGELGFLAAALGCHLHGLAGELAEAARTPWAMTAQDVVERLSDAFKALR